MCVYKSFQIAKFAKSKDSLTINSYNAYTVSGCLASIKICSGTVDNTQAIAAIYIVTCVSPHLDLEILIAWAWTLAGLRLATPMGCAIIVLLV